MMVDNRIGLDRSGAVRGRKVGPVPPLSIRELPAAPGVYRFRDGQGRALYLGRATNLRSRVGSYWGQLPGRRHLRRMVSQIGSIEAVECDSQHEAAWLERLLMQRSKPRWNRMVGGLENPVLVRMDTSARTPGLSLVHERVAGPGWEYFGPYLGGNRLRLALSAVHRVLPLALTEVAPSSSARDMARIRSVSPSDRDEFIMTIRALLRREPSVVASVGERLAELRTAAAERLEFERAATVHAEVGALTWLVAPQRVMAVDGGDATFTGWSDGCAVDFRVVSGCVDGWTIRRASESAVAARRAATLDSWRAYADRAAHLAARLATTTPMA